MTTKKRLFKPTNQQPNGLVLAYNCELEYDAPTCKAVPDSLAATHTDSLSAAAWARADSIRALDRIEPDPSFDPVGGLANTIRKGVVKGITSVIQGIAKSEGLEAVKEWWNDEDRENE